MTRIAQVETKPEPAIPSPRPITAGGRHLAAWLDRFDVERHWMPNLVVAWRTGRPLKTQPDDGKSRTHCSAFVAAATLDLGVYLLRPPVHSTILLANAQAAWLAAHGSSHGWTPVVCPLDAQRMANLGDLVIAAFGEADSRKAGHIAILRPSSRDDASIEFHGPEIINVGMKNKESTTVSAGFRFHKDAWRTRKIRYHRHAIDRSNPAGMGS